MAAARPRMICVKRRPIVGRSARRRRSADWMPVQLRARAHANDASPRHAAPRGASYRGVRRFERRAALGRRAWHRERRRWPAARHRRRRLGQDDDAGVARGAARARRRRSATPAAADLLAPRGAGNGAPRRTPAAPRAGLGVDDGATRVALGRYLPRHRRAAAARTCAADRPARRLHDPRSRRRRRPDGLGPAGARPGGVKATLPAEGHLPRDLFARRQQPDAAGRRAAPALPLVRALRRGAEGPVSRLCRGQAAAACARLRRPAALLGADDGGAGARAKRSAIASTMCWSTSTRTRTGCRRRSCWA